MTYIVLELFPEPFILTCQQGIVVPLESNLMQDLWRCWYHHDIQRLDVYFDEQNTIT